MSVKTWLEEKVFWLKTGANLKIANDGKAVEPIVIHYKDFFFEIDLDAETGEPTGDFGWTHGSPMTHIPVRDFYVAVRSDNE